MENNCFITSQLSVISKNSVISVVNLLMGKTMFAPPRFFLCSKQFLNRFIKSIALDNLMHALIYATQGFENI